MKNWVREMKFKSSSANRKPWEKISLDEIQPYPTRYNKIIVIGYLFIFSIFLTKFMEVNSIFEIAIPFIKLAVNGTLALALLKLIMRGSFQTPIKSFFQFVLPIYTIIMAIVIAVGFIYAGISLEDVFSSSYSLIFLIISILLHYFYVLFGLVCLGSVLYLLMSEHPKIQIHGLILVVLFNLFYLIPMFLFK
jgi:hypothetical protein